MERKALSTHDNIETLKFDYSKADFDAIRHALREIQWSDVLRGDANEQWITFSTILKQLETQHIPLKKPGSHQKKAPWMSYKAVKLLKKKHRMYNKYKSRGHPAYQKAAREAQTEMHRAKRSFEKKLAKSIDSDRKSFYTYTSVTGHEQNHP